MVVMRRSLVRRLALLRLGLRSWLLLVLPHDLLLHLKVPPMDTALLLLLAENLIIKSLSVVLNSQLCVVVNRNANSPVTTGLILRIVELDNVGVSQTILSRDALAGVKIQAHPDEVQGWLVGCRKDLSKGASPRNRQRVKHLLSEGRFHGLYVVRTGTPSDLKDPIELVHS